LTTENSGLISNCTIMSLQNGNRVQKSHYTGCGHASLKSPLVWKNSPKFP
jgi:hypothetical protein